MIKILMALGMPLGLYFHTLNAQIIIPTHANDAYSAYVYKLENKDYNIDFTDFRFSFINSPQYVLASEKSQENIELVKNIKEKVKQEDYEAAIPLLEKALSLDYTFAAFHLHLRNAYVALEKEELANKHHQIYNHLLNSLKGNNNGENCANAYSINHIKEAYFLVEHFQYKLAEKPSIEDGTACEIFHVKTKDNMDKYLFFDVDKMMAKYKELGLSINRP